MTDSPPQGNNPTPTAPAPAAPSPGPALATTPAASAGEPASAAESDKKTDKHRKLSYFEKLKGPGEGNRFIAIATGVMALAAAGTFYEAITAGSQTDKIIAADNRTASAIERTVDVASAAFGETAKQFHLDQRAWISMTSALTKSFSENQPWMAELVFSNSGKTPAVNVQSSLLYFVADAPIPGPTPEMIQRLEYQPTQSIAPQGHFVKLIGFDSDAFALSPAGKIGNAAMTTFSPAIKAKKKFIYYFGILKYDDVFGNHRESQFCVFLADPNPPWPVGNCRDFNSLN